MFPFLRIHGLASLSTPVLLALTALLVPTVPLARAETPSNGLSQAVEHAKHATVGILHATPEGRQSGYQTGLSIRGTGVHLRDGYIVTARHAVERTEGSKTVLAQEILVLTQNLDEVPAKLTGGSAYLDIAVYRVEPTGTPLITATAPFAEQEVIPGQDVFTVGYPLGWGPAIAFGRIGNPNTFLPTADTRLLQADVSACSGNSGGGLFNSAGELVGVIHAIIKTEQVPGEHGCSRFAFAVPGVLAKRIADALIKGERPRFSKLGIQMTAVKVGSRWRVAAGKVFEPALSGGVQKGDLLLAIEEMEITDAAQLKNYLMERTAPGQKVTLRVRRGDKDLDLPITLGAL